MIERPITLSANLREELSIDQMPDAGAIVIFGASGDLTKRKLIPAIFALYERNLLPEDFAVVGVARTAMTDEAFQEEVREALAKNGASEKLTDFMQHFSYVAGAYDQKETYKALQAHLAVVKEKHHTLGNAMFYLATPPSLFLTIVQGLSEGGLLEEKDSWSRIVIEKPFGHDLESALSLDKALKEYLKESQIYRIDHYVGKETVQNILMLRFANAIFEPIWNHRYIDRVEITVAEELGIEKRAGYYETAGALRDMFQNHMIQMLSLIAMEPPTAFEAEAYRNEIVKLISAIRPFDKQDLSKVSVRAQYVGSGAGVAYRDEENVSHQSMTETYVALRFMIDNWRWTGVPFYMRTGKRLPRKNSEIAITFKPVPHSIFKPIKPEDFSPNVLVLRMQPQEGMALSIEVKAPGSKLSLNTLEMSFSYSDFIKESIPDAYERLLMDCLLGDQSLFVRNDAVEASWRLFMPLLEAWERNDRTTPLHFYAACSEGPIEADRLLEGEHSAWRKI